MLCLPPHRRPPAARLSPHLPGGSFCSPFPGSAGGRRTDRKFPRRLSRVGIAPAISVNPFRSAAELSRSPRSPHPEFRCSFPLSPFQCRKPGAIAPLASAAVGTGRGGRCRAGRVPLALPRSLSLDRALPAPDGRTRGRHRGVSP